MRVSVGIFGWFFCMRRTNFNSKRFELVALLCEAVDYALEMLGGGGLDRSEIHRL